MFDLGWQEFLMVAVVLMLVVGPKDLPKVLRAITQVTGQARRMANEFRNGLNDIAADEKVKEVKQMMEDAKSGDIGDISSFLGVEDEDELKSIGSDIEKDIKTLHKETKETSDKVSKSPTKTKASAKSKAPAKTKSKS